MQIIVLVKPTPFNSSSGIPSFCEYGLGAAPNSEKVCHKVKRKTLRPTFSWHGMLGHELTDESSTNPFWGVLI